MTSKHNLNNAEPKSFGAGMAAKLIYSTGSWMKIIVSVHSPNLARGSWIALIDRKYDEVELS